MTKYREILRLKSLGISEREIATSCSVSRNIVARVCKRAAELNILKHRRMKEITQARSVSDKLIFQFVFFL